MTFPETPLPRIDELDQSISQMSKSEISAFHDFESVYRVEHPFPQRGTTSLNWQFWVALATSLATVILAAFRTGQAFYLAAVAKGDPIFSSAEAIAAVVAIEGSVVVYALQRAKEKRKADSTMSEVGLGIAFIVSALAGLFQSYNILSASNTNDTVLSVLNYLLVIAMGLGATALAWVGGNLLGVQLVRLEEMNTWLTDEYAKAVHGWRLALLKAWGKSSEQEAVRIHKGSRYGIGVHERSRTFSERGNERENERLRVPKDEIVAIFDKVFSDTGSLAGVSDVARELVKRRNPDQSDNGYERLKGVVSETRKDWMREKKIGGS